MRTVPLLTAVIKPLALTVAMLGLLVVYCVPVLAAVTFFVELSAYVAVTVSWAAWPGCVSVVGDAVRVNEFGIGVVEPRVIGGMAFIRFAVIVNRSDCPDVVTPLLT